MPGRGWEEVGLRSIHSAEPQPAWLRSLIPSSHRPPAAGTARTALKRSHICRNTVADAVNRQLLLTGRVLSPRAFLDELESECLIHELRSFQIADHELAAMP